MSQSKFADIPVTLLSPIAKGLDKRRQNFIKREVKATFKRIELTVIAINQVCIYIYIFQTNKN